MGQSDSLHIYDQLNQLGINFEVIQHPAAHTTEMADSFIEGIEGVRTKTLLLTNRKKTQYYMLIMDDQKRLDMKKFAEIIGSSRLQFANEENILEKINQTPGTISIFGLEYENAKDIKVYYDLDITHEARQSFHPNDNTKTIFISTPDTFKYIESVGFELEIVDL
ncbi:prolyl-tRNA synthetase associated domain-containing protein [Allofustis seminis]|uniref:prolyl-tRNA synthetase associated domain-containing protein n=1 Tax=Allofustis seminis TaxID=166939 RepID=UPI0003731E46|nr:prolyl-tRNA synthetase associated domain-containing protein [Allofustis seminis]